ncbi:MAG: PrsW family intramembrane metalloprotease [Crocinitomicaceae bacterium]
MIAFYIVVALFIAWIWVDYFRLIDIFEKNNLGYVLLIFLLGAASVGIVLLIQNFILDPSGWELNGGFLNQFAYSVFGIGLVEEVAKLTPFLLFHQFFKKHLREPIDYIAFICVSALGFSAAENVLYFQTHGAGIISSRAILCSISHMFDSAIVAYSFVLVRFHPEFKSKPLIIFVGLLLAALAHGIYDFWLIYEGIQFGFLVTLFFFFITISVFATILNNAINNSGQFTYKKVIDIDRLSKRMLQYYAIVFATQLVLVSVEENFGTSLIFLLYSIFTTGFIVIISILRMSRFQLIEDRWNKIKLELPFQFLGKSESLYEGFQPFSIRIKGASYNEIYLSQFYEEYVYLHSVSPNRSVTGRPVLAFIEKKIFLKNDEVYYLARLHETDAESSFELTLLKPKESGITKTKNNHPIVARMEVREVPNPLDTSTWKKSYRFVEWVYLKK